MVFIKCLSLINTCQVTLQACQYWRKKWRDGRETDVIGTNYTAILVRRKETA